METHYESENENPPCHSESRLHKYLQQTLNSINEFLLSLVMSYVGYCFKLLRMSWYKMMKPFRTNLKLVIKEYFCVMHDSYSGIDCYFIDFMSSGMGK